MKKTIKLFIWLILLLPISQLKAQITGYGSGTTTDPNWSSGVHYMDDIRAEVTSISSCGLDATINISSATGAFTVGDEAVIIQMKGGTIGTHQNVKFVAGSCSGTYKIQKVGSTWNTYSTGGSNNVQIIKIYDYINFTLNGGVVTCHPYNGTTGGVLAMIVNGTLTINDGIFTVAGKGYKTLDAGVTLSTGGAGASASSTWTSGGSTSAPNTAEFDAGTGCNPVSLVYTGNASGPANNAGGTSANSGTQISFGGSTRPTLLVMGDPGYWISGYGGGTGAGGGGYGGTGGSTAAICTINTAGAAGAQGQAGGPGGAAGKGGEGGGAMVIKAADVVISTATAGQVVFSCAGGNGYQGGNGSNGGLGGAGGAGGEGCCPTGLDAGPGANGDVGDGGKGGDGGNGGDAGYIWISCQNSYTTNAGSRSQNFRANGGAAGRKGNGGWGDYNTTGTPHMVNRCNSSPCTPPTPCIIACDADMAMCLLALNTVSTNPIGAKVQFLDGTSNVIGEYDKALNKLDMLDGACPDHYIAYWNDGQPEDPDIMFDYFDNGNAYNGTIDYLNTTTSGCFSGGSAVDIEFRTSAVSGSDVVLGYHHSTNPTEAGFLREEDHPDGNMCFVDDCISEPPTGNGTTPQQEVDGSDGTTGTGGVVLPQAPASTDNVIIDDPSFWKRNPSGIKESLGNPLNAKVYPNPATREAWIEMEVATKGRLIITLTDIAGKKVLIKEENVLSGNNRYMIDIRILSPGLYKVELKQDDKTSYLNLTIN